MSEKRRFNPFRLFRRTFLDFLAASVFGFVVLKFVLIKVVVTWFFENLHQTMSHVRVKLSWSPQPWLTGNVAKKLSLKEQHSMLVTTEKSANDLQTVKPSYKLKLNGKTSAHERLRPTQTAKVKKKTCKFFCCSTTIAIWGGWENGIT